MKTLADDPEVKAMAAQGRRWDAAEAAANAAAAPYREGMKKFYGRGLTQTEIEQSDALSDEANRIFRKVLGEHGFTHAATPGAGAGNDETGAEKAGSGGQSSFRYGMLVKSLKNHPARPAIMMAFSLLILAVLLGLFVPPWRSYAWGSAAFAFLLLILSRL